MAKKEYICPECGFSAKSPAGLRGHRQFKHGVPPSSPQLPLQQQDRLITESTLEQHISELERKLGFSSDGEVSELRQRLGLTGEKPITDRVDSVERQIQQQNKQLEEIKRLAEVANARAAEAADTIAQLKESHNELVPVVNENAEEVKRIIPIVEAKLEGVVGDLDLLYQATDDHQHTLLMNLGITGGPSGLSDAVTKRFNERVALAKKRRLRTS